MSKINFSYYQLTLFHWLFLGLMVPAGLGMFRYYTGPEWAMILLFLIPVSLNAWYAGKVVGIYTSLTCSLSWLIADMIMDYDFSHDFILYINELVRLMVFLFLVFVLIKLKTTLKQLRDSALFDFLTGIYNRQGFNHLVEKQIDQIRRHFKTFSLVYFDLDNFKTVNDTQGHQEGDRLLRNLSHLLKTQIRPMDILGRLGGDEFVIYMPDTDKNDALAACQRWVEKATELMKLQNWPITFSLGIVVFNNMPKDLQEVLLLADQLMYSAKRKGKNTFETRVIGQ